MQSTAVTRAHCGEVRKNVDITIYESVETTPKPTTPEVNLMEEKKENRTNIEDLPQAEQDLSQEEAKEVKGGIIVANTEGDIHVVSKPPGIRLDTGNMK